MDFICPSGIDLTRQSLVIRMADVTAAENEVATDRARRRRRRGEEGQFTNLSHGIRNINNISTAYLNIFQRFVKT